MTNTPQPDLDALLSHATFVPGLHPQCNVRIQPDGRFSVPGLPPGEARVEVRRSYGSTAPSQSFECRPGTFAQLRLD